MALKAFLALVSFIRFFDVQLKIVLAAVLHKRVRRAVPLHKGFQLLAFQPRKAAHQLRAKAVVDIFFLLLLQQPLLKAHHRVVFPELEQADQLININAGARWADRGKAFYIGPAEVEHLFIVQPVLQRVHAVVAGAQLYFGQHGDAYLQRNIKLQQVLNFGYGKLLRGLAQVRKPDRIFIGGIEGVKAFGIGNGAAAVGAEHAHRLQRIGARAVEHRTLYLVLCRSRPRGQRTDKDDIKTKFPQSAAASNKTNCKCNGKVNRGLPGFFEIQDFTD